MPDSYPCLAQFEPELAAHEVVLEMSRAGKITDAEHASRAFTHLLDHYRSELKRIQQEQNTTQ